MILRSLVACLSLSATLIPSAVYAADAASCAKPHFSDVGWTDITATTQIANQILTGLGYKPNITVLCGGCHFPVARKRRHRCVSRQLDAAPGTAFSSAARQGRQDRRRDEQPHRRPDRFCDFKGRL